MTEAEWLACDDPAPMLEFLRGRFVDRKLRYFAVACCWRIYHQMQEQLSQEAIVAAARYLEGQVGAEELERRRSGPPMFPSSHFVIQPDGPAFVSAVIECTFYCARAVSARCFLQTNDELQRDLAYDQERRSQACVLRCVFGPLPFRHASMDPAYLTGTARTLAEVTHESRDYRRLPVLADALEDAGCTDREVLDHCRGAGPHARGCWVVDLVLGKE